jgi:Beta-propeller repeat
VAVDAQGNMYVARGTSSTDFPVTAGAYDGTFNNPGSPMLDRFVAKLSPTEQLLWSTYLGGSGYDRAYAIEVDPQGFVYVAGRAGLGFPVTPGAFQTTFYGSQESPVYGPPDGFLCKLRPDGSGMVFCSYFGNADPGPVRDIALDPEGNIYPVSMTSVHGFPTSWFAGSAQPVGRGADRNASSSAPSTRRA